MSALDELIKNSAPSSGKKTSIQSSVPQAKTSNTPLANLIEASKPSSTAPAPAYAPLPYNKPASVPETKPSLLSRIGNALLGDAGTPRASIPKAQKTPILEGTLLPDAKLIPDNFIPVGTEVKLPFIDKGFVVSDEPNIVNSLTKAAVEAPEKVARTYTEMFGITKPDSQNRLSQFSVPSYAENAAKYTSDAYDDINSDGTGGTGQKIAATILGAAKAFGDFANDTLIYADPLVKGAQSTALEEKLFKNVIETHNLPKTLYFKGGDVQQIIAKGALGNREAEDLIRVIGGDAKKIRNAFKNGITIEIPSEKIVTLQDKPYWEKIKKFFGGQTSLPKIVSRTGAPATETVRGLLPIPTGDTTALDDLIAQSKPQVPITENVPRETSQVSTPTEPDVNTTISVPSKIPASQSTSLEGVKLDQSTRLTPEEATPLAQKAADLHYEAVHAPAIANGRPVIIGGDQLKNYFGKDFNDNNHPIYRQASRIQYDRALKENPDPTVVFTGGGPASAKTELITRNLVDDGFKGIIYDSNFSNFEGALDQIKAARAAGKKIQIRGVISDLEKSRFFANQREASGGHAITDSTFATGHAGFPDVIVQLLEKRIISPEEVMILDTRKLKTLQDALDSVRNQIYLKDPLDTLKNLGYTKESIKAKYGKQNYNSITGKRKESIPSIRKVGETSTVNRPNNRTSNGRRTQENVGQGSSGERNQSQLKPVGEGKIKTSRLSLNIEKNAIEKGLATKFGDLPEYKTVNLKEQAEFSAKILQDDPEKAYRIAMGEEKAPEGILPEMVLDAVERAAIKNGDVQTLLDLANSKLSTEATAMGQRIRALGERDQESPVKVMQDVIKSREESIKKKYGKDLKKVKKEIVEDIKKEIKKATPKKQDWSEFIQSIKC